MTSPRPPRGRWAPSPTGSIHVGNARTALVAWLSIRQQDGTLVWRLEDLDPPRVVEGLADEQQRDLEWLGLDWHEGAGRGGPHGPYAQSERDALYEATLRRLAEHDLLFPCSLTRRELRDIASAPHGPEATPYPPSLRPAELADGWLDDLLEDADPDASVRLRVDEYEARWSDLLLGPQSERVDLAVGDFVLRRRDGIWAYQLAVVADDIAMEIDEVVRGADLLHSTGRQILLFEALGGKVPRFGHVPLMTTLDGDKLSKRDASLELRALRAASVAPELLVGYLAHTLGLLDRPEGCQPADLIELFDWAALDPTPTAVPSDLAKRLLSRRLPSAPKTEENGR